MAYPANDHAVAESDEGHGGAAVTARPVPTTPPRTPTEEAIAGIWRDVLDRTGIGVFDNFFDLEAHSLHAIQVVSRIRKTLGVDIPVRDFFKAPTIAALAATVAVRSSSASRVIGPRPSDSDPVLSFDQERLWLESQLLPGSAYNVHGRRRLVGPVDVAALDASVRAIIARHETLRTRFPLVSGQPVQVVDPVDNAWHVRIEDLTGHESGRADAACRLADEQAATTFDLAQGPLFRCLLVKLRDGEHLLSVTMHHIISDAWSIGLFVRELSALYSAGGDVERAGLPALPIQYRDYAVWQRGLLTGDTLEREVGYWRRHLDGAPPALVLPTAHRQAPAQDVAGGRIRTSLSADETAALRDFCRKHGVTPFMALLAGFATVLSRWSGQPDLVVGVPVASRTDAGTDQLIGFFVNTLPLRVDLSGDPTFEDLLARVRKTALDGYAHADAPFDVIVKNLQANRDRRRTPVFQVVLNVIGSPEAERISGVSVEPVDAPVLPSKFDLALTAQEIDGALWLQLDFNAVRYDAAMMRILTGHLGTLVRSVLEDPTRTILDYPLRDNADVENPPALRPAPRRSPTRPAGSPDRTAVIHRDGAWSHRRLNRVAGQVAQVIAESHPPGGGRVGVTRRPTATFLAAVLGCLKAGVTFSVIEPDSPVAARYLGVSTTLDASPEGEAADGTIDLRTVLHEDTVPSTPVSGPALPAGDWAVGQLGLRHDDRIAVLSSSAGLLVSALSSACCAGAAMVVPDGSFAHDVDALVTWLRTSAVSVLYVSPPLLRALTATRPVPELPALRYVFVENRGEVIFHDVADLRGLSPACRCVGVYRVGMDGLPRASYVVPDEEQPWQAPLRVPLGAELAHAPATLRHPSGLTAAIGEVAEICFGSYRTGDLGRRRPDGTLEFVSGDPAADPAETLAAVRDLDEVSSALVTEHVGMDGHTMLLGYVTGPDPAFGTAGIRQHLVRRLLPDHLIPQHLFVLDRLPLTPLGDYDLGALPEPDADSGPADNYVAPRTPMERRLVEILQELLTIDRVGIHDTFFELGGFSLLATRLTTRVREMFDVELPLRNVLESPTVGELAQVIVRTQGELAGIANLEALLDEIEPDAAI